MPVASGGQLVNIGGINRVIPISVKFGRKSRKVYKSRKICKICKSRRIHNRKYK